MAVLAVVVHHALLLLLVSSSALLGIPLLLRVRLLLLLHGPWTVPSRRGRPGLRQAPGVGGHGRRLRRRVRLVVLPNDRVPAKPLAPVVHLLRGIMCSRMLRARQQG